MTCWIYWSMQHIYMDYILAIIMILLENSHISQDIACKNYDDALRCIFNCEIPNQKNIKVATIFDSFSHNSFK